MTRLAMNFAVTRRWSPVSVSVLVVCLAGSAHQLWIRADLVDRLAAQGNQLLQAKRAYGERLASGGGRGLTPEAARAAGELADDLRRPWEDMLNSLQRATQGEVLITRLQQDAAAERLLVTGQADTGQAFLAYVARLREDPRWAAVEPLSEEAAPAGGDSGKALSFQLAATWRRK